MKPEESFYDNMADIDKKFDKAGRIYQNPEVFHKWGKEET